MQGARRTSRRAHTSAALALVVFLAACGGGGGGGGDGATGTGSGDEGTASNVSEAQGTEQFEPGPVAYRVVNLLDEDVDVYARTSGQVEAFLVAEGLAPGTVLDHVAPPPDGRLVVTEAGAGDPTCVSGCDHFVAETSSQLDDGDSHTLLLHQDGDTASAMTLWENPTGGATSANAMPDPDPAGGLVVVTAVAVTDADFGMRLAFADASGCQTPVGNATGLVGGNQTPVYAITDATVEVVLHEQSDGTCSEQPVGGPFAVDGERRARSHLILHGSPGDLEAIVLAMPAAAVPEVTDAEIATPLAGFVQRELGVGAADAACLADAVVAEVGAGRIRAEMGDFIRFEDVEGEVADELEAALVTAFDTCGVAPPD